jgi:hypothetical protein
VFQVLRFSAPFSPIIRIAEVFAKVSAKMFDMSDMFFSNQDVVTVVCFARDSEMCRENLYFFVELLKRFGIVKIDINFLRVDPVD